MLIIVWNWFCAIGQLMFVTMYIIGIVCRVRGKKFKFSEKFEKKHPILVNSVYIVVAIWMLIGLMAAIIRN